MSSLARVGLRTRLAIALVGIAVLAVGLATLLANRGLHPRVAGAAEARIQRSAEHMAEVAASVYGEEGGWTVSRSGQILNHLSDAQRPRRHDSRSSRRGRRNEPDVGAAASGDQRLAAVVVRRRSVGTSRRPAGATLLTRRSSTSSTPSTGSTSRRVRSRSRRRSSCLPPRPDPLRPAAHHASPPSGSSAATSPRASTGRRRHTGCAVGHALNCLAETSARGGAPQRRPSPTWPTSSARR